MRHHVAIHRVDQRMFEIAQNTYQLQPIRGFVPLDKLEDRPVFHPIRYHCKGKQRHIDTNEWEEVRVGKSLPDYCLVTEFLVRTPFRFKTTGSRSDRTCFNLHISRSTFLSPASSSTSSCGRQILSDLIAMGSPLYRPFQTSAAPPKARACDPSVSIPSSITYEDGNLACARHILLRRTNNFLCSFVIFPSELVACDSFGLKSLRIRTHKGRHV